MQGPSTVMGTQTQCELLHQQISPKRFMIQLATVAPAAGVHESYPHQAITGACSGAKRWKRLRQR
jgi:hypothetical protein